MSENGQDQTIDNGAPPPVRLCCFQRHAGVVCPDGKVMCCICFGRFDVADLHTFAGDDKPTDVCAECGSQEEAYRRGGEGSV